MPTGNIVSDKWFIRITLPWEAVDLLIKNNPMLFVDHTRQLVVSHLGTKTEKQHVHCLVELSGPLQKQSVDKRYKKLFGVSGADYSSKQWDGDMGAGAGSYLFHDSLATVMVQKGFTDDEVKEFQRLNADIQKVVEVNKQRASGRCVERILTKIGNEHWSRQQIATQLINDIHDGVMYEPGDYVLKRYIEEIYMKQLKGTQYDHYVRIRVESLVGESLRYESEKSYIDNI